MTLPKPALSPSRIPVRSPPKVNNVMLSSSLSSSMTMSPSRAPPTHLSMSFSTVNTSHSKMKFGDSHHDDPTCPNHVFQRILVGKKCSVHDSPLKMVHANVIPSPRSSSPQNTRGTVFFSSNVVANEATEAAKLIAQQTIEKQRKKMDQLERFRLLTLQRTSEIKKEQLLKKKVAATAPQTPVKAAPAPRRASKRSLASPHAKNAKTSGTKSAEKNEYIKAVKKAQSSLTALAKRI